MMPRNGEWVSYQASLRVGVSDISFEIGCAREGLVRFVDRSIVFILKVFA